MTLTEEPYIGKRREVRGRASPSCCEVQYVTHRPVSFSTASQHVISLPDRQDEVVGFRKEQHASNTGDLGCAAAKNTQEGYGKKQWLACAPSNLDPFGGLV